VTAPAEVAGRYRLERRLGAGGMSTVFLANDTVLERAVAVKLLAEHLADDDAFVARFRREALAAARLQHPNVVQVFDSGHDAESGRHYIVMEYVDGPSCADLLRENSELDVDESVQILRDACQGLDYAHRAGVVHRDVKPGNLLITKEMHTTKIADFGIAKAAELTRITQVGSVLGTAAYLSPEQAHGDEAGPSSDIYSLGVCAYQFLTGRLPHEYGSLTELALKQQQDSITPITSLRPEVPRELDEAVRLCLEREPERRYGSALQFALALDAGLHGETTEVTRQLSLEDPGATRSMRHDELDTAATRAMRSRPVPVPPSRAVPPARSAPAARPREQVERADPRDARRAERRRNLGTFLALLAAIAAVAVLGLVLLSSSSGNTVRPVDRQDVEQQIQGLRDFLNEHSR
jgi:eukaryotic-like serine/threonine-protein kinase